MYQLDHVECMAPLKKFNPCVNHSACYCAHLIGSSSSSEMQAKFKVPPKHSRRVTVTRWFQKKECRVSNVKLSFPRDTKIKCRFHDNRDTDPKKVKKTPLFLIRDVLKDCIEDDSTDRLTAKLEGKYVWMETKLITNVEDPVPI